MSASRRLSKLKRSTNPMVSDVLNVKVSNDSNQTVKIDENLVKPVTILTWHEQRLNKMDGEIKNLTEYVPKELVVGLVETIEHLNKKIELLTDAYNSLIEQLNTDDVETEVETEVQNELITLSIKEN
jgi:Mg2+ and Co2+ transporter CorA